MTSHDHSEEALSDLIEIEANLSAQERHLGGIESSYRSLMSKWMLACYAGIGFVLANQGNIVGESGLLVAGISLGGAIGIYSLWRIDVLNYHILLSATYAEAMQLELRHPSLPKYRNRMAKMLASQRLGLRENVAIFYLIGMVPLLVVSALGVSFFMLNKSRTLGMLSAGLGLIAISAVSSHVYSATRRTRVEK